MKNYLYKFYKNYRLWSGNNITSKKIRDQVLDKKNEVKALKNLVSKRISKEDRNISNKQLLAAEIRRNLVLKSRNPEDVRSLKKNLRRIDEEIEMRLFYRQDLDFSERDLSQWLVGLHDRLRIIDAKVTIDDLEEILLSIDFRLSEIRNLLSSNHFDFVK